MKNFFRKLGAFLTAVRVWSVNLVVLLLLVYVVGLVVLVIQRMPEAVDPTGKVLILKVDGPIVDQKVFPEEFVFPFVLPDEDQVQTRDLVRLIRAAAADERLAGVLIDFSQAGFPGPSTALQIAGELSALRRSGKPVIAYSESLGTGAYLMAAQADEIYVHPSGAVDISGLGGYRDYTRDLTEKLRITVHNYSQGDYKSAVEGFTRADMSEADRRQRQELYQPIWDTMKQRMGEARGIGPALFQQMADEHPVLLVPEAAYDNLAEAEALGLIDGTRSFPDLRAYMMQRFGVDDSSDKETYPHVTAGAYLSQVPEEPPPGDDNVAVVFVQGAIQNGPEAPGIAGSDDIARLLRRAHEKEETRALVMRVNSPGGSIIASDLIRDEFEAARAKGIPVVVSMGDVAASGGVWISTPADRIYAQPTTITGSIGVAIAFPTLENVFDYVGVNFDGVTTSDYAGWGLQMPVNEQMDAIFARWAASAYNRFIGLVAAGRDRDPEYIRSIAGGRVWIASAARERGLVDEFGTMQDAIAGAAELAGLEEYGVDYVVKKISPRMALLRYLDILEPVQAGYGAFARQVMALFRGLESLSEPRATVMCTTCLIELR